MEDDDESIPKPLDDWSDEDIEYLKENYGITSMVEFAKPFIVYYSISR